MKACRNCRLIVYSEKICPKCNGELSEKFSGMIIVLDPERSEISKVAEINVVGNYAVRVK
ncbi:TPA: DNA-directed RNA polymerase subunit E'' [Candidatus Micrarchaeota archaeon]|nr:DNA-directed RNA polymerase subunit E'' [Candidatus Micrarchaeota archaeon]